MREMKLQDLKSKSPPELLAFAEEQEIENASTMRKQELMFAILKQLALKEVDIIGEGVVEVLSDGFGFLRSPEANYLPGPDDIYVSPSHIRRYGLRTGDTVEGQIRSPKDGERYFALMNVRTINFDQPEVARHRINFDNLTPLYPDERLKLELVDEAVAAAAPQPKPSRRAEGDEENLRIRGRITGARAGRDKAEQIGGPPKRDITGRIIDLICPLGKGQRALIISP